MSDVILPWEADTDTPEAIWAKGCLSLKDFSSYLKNSLEGDDLLRVRKIAGEVVRFNKWVVCLSKTPYYIRTLYPYVAAAWIYSRRDTADIVDVAEIVDGVFSYGTEAKQEFSTKIRETGLLIIPHIDPEYMEIGRVV